MRTKLFKVGDKVKVLRTARTSLNKEGKIVYGMLDTAIMKSKDDRSQAFKQARLASLELGRTVKFVNADMVQAELEKLGLNSSDLGNAAGGIFRGKNWKDTGRAILSNRGKSHRRKITVWEYTGETSQPSIQSQLEKLGDANKSPAAQQAVKNAAWQDTIGTAAPANISGTVPTRENLKVGMQVKSTAKSYDSLESSVGVVASISNDPSGYWPVRVTFPNYPSGLLHAYDELVFAQAPKPRYVPATPENVSVGSKIRITNLAGYVKSWDVGVTGVVIKINPDSIWNIRFRYDEGTRAAGRIGAVGYSEIEVLV